MEKDTSVTNVYLAGAELPGIKKTEENEMLLQMSTNQNSMSLAFPYIQSKAFKRDIIIAHDNGERCFMNIEMKKLAEGEVPFVEGFPYKVVQGDIRTDAISHAKLVGSSKLETYVKNYDKQSQIGCVIWCREPYACYTILIMQPWKVNGD